jgi:hypothetical protein
MPGKHRNSYSGGVSTRPSQYSECSHQAALMSNLDVVVKSLPRKQRLPKYCYRVRANLSERSDGNPYRAVVAAGRKDHLVDGNYSYRERLYRAASPGEKQSFVCRME